RLQEFLRIEGRYLSGGNREINAVYTIDKYRGYIGRSNQLVHLIGKVEPGLCTFRLRPLYEAANVFPSFLEMTQVGLYGFQRQMEGLLEGKHPIFPCARFLEGHFIFIDPRLHGSAVIQVAGVSFLLRNVRFEYLIDDV